MSGLLFFDLTNNESATYGPSINSNLTKMSNPSDQPPTELPLVVSTKPAAVWQDRRGMFQRGKEVHEPSVRRPSQGSGGAIEAAVRRASTASNGSLGDKPLSNDTASPAAYYPTASESRRRVSSTLYLVELGRRLTIISRRRLPLVSLGILRIINVEARITIRGELVSLNR
jgi:hypothetical protein